MNNEVWKDVKNYEGLYQVSNLGKLRSLKRNGTTGKLLKGFYDQCGYIRVALCKNNKAKKYKLHRLIAEAFIPNPNNLPQINHDNGIKTDNRVENLEWCTASFNTKHSYINNLNKTRGKKIKVTNKNNNYDQTFRSMRLASMKMGYNKGYLFKKIKNNIYENEIFKWEVLNNQYDEEE